MDSARLRRSHIADLRKGRAQWGGSISISPGILNLGITRAQEAEKDERHDSQHHQAERDYHRNCEAIQEFLDLVNSDQSTLKDENKVERFLGCFLGNNGLGLIMTFPDDLDEIGLYEKALFNAYTSGSVNHSNWTKGELDDLFAMANREKLRQAGHPLPGPGPFTLYRGVAGSLRVRRVRGYSWTSSLEIAWWFAQRFAGYQQLSDPAVYKIVVGEKDILAYTNDREESEFLVALPRQLRPIKVIFTEGMKKSLEKKYDETLPVIQH